MINIDLILLDFSIYLSRFVGKWHGWVSGGWGEGRGGRIVRSNGGV